MPYKTGSLKGELTVPELRRLVRQHNELMSLKIPPDGIVTGKRYYVLFLSP